MSFASAATTGSIRTARSTSSQRRSPCWIWISPSRCWILIDRISVSPDARLRIVDAIEQGYRESGEVLVETAPRDGEEPQTFRFSQRFECKNCNIRYEEPEPRLFSFNNPFGACPRCQGFGNTIDFDLNLVIPNKALTLSEGAVEPWTKPKYKPLATDMRRYARAAGIPLDVPWQDLDPDQQNVHHQRRREVRRNTRILRAS